MKQESVELKLIINQQTTKSKNFYLRVANLVKTWRT